MPVSLDAMLKDLPPARRAKIERDAAAMILEIRTLSQLRKELGLTQAQVAKAMETSQGNLAQIEAKHDLLVSTVTRVVEAFGGSLFLRASLPGRGDYEISLGSNAKTPVVPKRRKSPVTVPSSKSASRGARTAKVTRRRLQTG